MTLTVAQIIDAASAAIVSRCPRIFTPTPNAFRSAFYSALGEFCGNSMQTASCLSGALIHSKTVVELRKCVPLFRVG
jgi:hypothetical protein